MRLGSRTLVVVLLPKAKPCSVLVHSKVSLLHVTPGQQSVLSTNFLCFLTASGGGGGRQHGGAAGGCCKCRAAARPGHRRAGLGRQRSAGAGGGELGRGWAARGRRAADWHRGWSAGARPACLPSPAGAPLPPVLRILLHICPIVYSALSTAAGISRWRLSAVRAEAQRSIESLCSYLRRPQQAYWLEQSWAAGCMKSKCRRATPGRCSHCIVMQACYTSEDRAAGHELPVVATPLPTWDACGALQRIEPSILPSSDAKLRRCKARPLPATWSLLARTRHAGMAFAALQKPAS